ncbi:MULTISPECIES: hypothetical protein [Vibrio]|uniref:hypothetical protein n=1 Tax=Vibrio TaxID=662 RepID=UPI002965537C|nr:hypothetical protein [Vibrio sp. 704]EJL6744912.1 hypothetical protein [Vibrio alginolyticus]MDG2633526.1 hypothetical protein [Vibrio parahaemolyticus]MDW2015205.1 hypothetical protein [Vibrio sp. 704]HCH1217043.1 hypothetical protein [Vibrio parahaemolyticus]HEQ3533757.1 hypothetical protein [Vibrio parahaemolyticus]
MTQTLETKLKALLHADCFRPTPEDNSITLTQLHKQAADGETRKSWTQKLTITGLEGDEIFFSFDLDDHQYYSRYILGKEDKFYAKACDYIMLKKTADRWCAYIGELKMKRVCKDEVDRQTKGTQAFLEYIKNLLKYDGEQELNNLTFVRKVISSRKISKSSERNRNRPSGRARKRTTSALSLDPITDVLGNERPYNEITATTLLFNDSDRAHQKITLKQFLAQA